VQKRRLQNNGTGKKYSRQRRQSFTNVVWLRAKQSAYGKKRFYNYKRLI
jgi:hypothetical protein